VAWIPRWSSADGFERTKQDFTRFRKHLRSYASWIRIKSAAHTWQGANAPIDCVGKYMAKHWKYQLRCQEQRHEKPSNCNARCRLRVAESNQYYFELQGKAKSNLRDCTHANWVAVPDIRGFLLLLANLHGRSSAQYCQPPGLVTPWRAVCVGGRHAWFRNRRLQSCLYRCLGAIRAHNTPTWHARESQQQSAGGRTWS
jgi:hypothetical protein